ncbi:hypothetical protein, partial [Streptomyces sp. FH025]|uniref:hypothetical protein n=1 Tax=Streptomyces sp. FH025 TaxID=2815937 RepID=UPI001A9FF969
MSRPEPGPDGPEPHTEARAEPHTEPRQEAYASGDATIYMAGRDQFIATGAVHVHYEDGGLRRIGSGEKNGDDCPYPGMAAFESTQAEWFFGRDAVLG